MTDTDAVRAAAYCRLSREDGDKSESDSIVNQQRLIEDYCAGRGFTLAAVFADDGATGTNFDRPQFRRMLEAIEAGAVNCVIVKDLSRFGRDYIDMGYYLERYFPSRGVRFIAVNDGVDSRNGPYDMMLPLKNVFNAQYAKDISGKVRSAFRTKQQRGEFCGAFACYGYSKDPTNRNRLVVDPVAAEVVRRIFRMAAEGVGQVRIARALNAEHIPCPSAYKRMMGSRYTNGRRLPETGYWTYSTVHKILRCEAYLGNMVANRSIRAGMHARAKTAERSEWIVVEGTHEAIVPRALWDAVQAVIARHARPVGFSADVALFAGLLRCGDCGRSLVRTARASYTCGSYRRYGASVCTSHTIREDALAAVVLGDLNRVLSAVDNMERLARRGAHSGAAREREDAREKLEAALSRVRRLKQDAYEDYRESLLSREEFLRYRADYGAQEASLAAQLDARAEDAEARLSPWTEELLRRGALAALDRATLSQALAGVRVFEGGRIEITYRCSEALRPLMEEMKTGGC